MCWMTRAKKVAAIFYFRCPKVIFTNLCTVEYTIHTIATSIDNGTSPSTFRVFTLIFQVSTEAALPVKP